MSGRSTRRSIRSLARRIAEHEVKIAAELAKDRPDEALVAYWSSEIRAFAGRRERLRKRLTKHRRRERRP